jgi:hypothetical protein
LFEKSGLTRTEGKGNDLRVILSRELMSMLWNEVYTAKLQELLELIGTGAQFPNEAPYELMPYLLADCLITQVNEALKNFKDDADKVTCIVNVVKEEDKNKDLQSVVTDIRWKAKIGEKFDAMYELAV